MDDQAGLSALRAQCPVSENNPEIDLQVALGLLGDVTLYAQALRGGPTTAERTTN